MKKCISILICLIMIFASTAVFATTSFKTILECPNVVIKSGEELEIVVKLEDFLANEKGINVLMATLDYDKNIFEVIEQEDITSIQFWDNPMYNKENGKLIIDSYKFIDESHNAIKIKFKVKEEIKDSTTTEIKLTDITASDGDNDILSDNAIASVQIEKTTKALNSIEFDSNIFPIVLISILVAIVIISVAIVMIKKRK